MSNSARFPWKNNPRWNIARQTWLVEEGKVGDCWRCCVAAVMNLPAEEVPHFAERTTSFNTVLHDTQVWLNERGWLIINLTSEYEYFSHDGPTIIPPTIEIGPTVRSKGRGNNHAVVMIGDHMVYDPHPSTAGLLATTGRHLIMPIHYRY